MIQPTYSPIGYFPPDQIYYATVKASYGISSGLATGINTGVTIANLSSRFSKGGRTISYIGLLTGTSQMVLGLVNIRKEEEEYSAVGPLRITSYKNQNRLSYFNIAAGTTTMLTSAFNLLLNDRLKDKRNTVNFFSYPGLNNTMTTGLSFTRTL
jgi:hypothetical protein